MRSLGPHTLLWLTVLAGGCNDQYEQHLQAEAKQKQEQANRPAPSKAADEATRVWIKDTTPAARERLAELAKIAEAVDGRPPVAEPEIVTPPGVALELDPTAPAFNTGLIQYEELRMPCAEVRRAKEREAKDEDDRPVALLGLGLKTRAWLSCGACLAAENHPEFTPGDPLAQRGCYERLLAPEFLAVVRVRERIDGEVVTKAGGSVKGSFRSGAMWADVLLVRVEDGAYLAGFPVVAESSESISSARDVGELLLEQDLSTNFEAALDRALAEQLAGEPTKNQE